MSHFFTNQEIRELIDVIKAAKVLFHLMGVKDVALELILDAVVALLGLSLKESELEQCATDWYEVGMIDKESLDFVRKLLS